MIGLEDRQVVARNILMAHTDGARLRLACETAGIDVRTLQRWKAGEGLVSGDGRPAAVRPVPAHALSPAERAQVLRVANEPRFADVPPARIVPMLADEGVYIASESSFARVLREHGQAEHRGRAKAPKATRPPTTHAATAPRQVWCWDMTYLPAAVVGQWFHLYLILDLYSRHLQLRRSTVRWTTPLVLRNALVPKAPYYWVGRIVGKRRAEVRLQLPGRLTPFLSALAALVATSAEAVILPGDGTVVALPGTSIAAEPFLAGTAIAQSSTLFSFTIYEPNSAVVTPVGTATGTVESLVVKELLTGTLDFYWRVTNTSANQQPLLGAQALISDFTLKSFASSVYDANWRSDLAGGTSATFANRLQDQIDFRFTDFSNPLAVTSLHPGQTSTYFFLHTDATQYADTALMSIETIRGDLLHNGDSGFSFATFAPSPVPEPAPYLMLTAGLGIVGLRRKFLRRAT